MRILLSTMCALLAAMLCAPAQPSEQTSKAVLVTGASSGIGRKITEHLAAEGHFVYATARKEEDLKALGAIKNVQPLRLDVTQPADIAAAVEAVTKAGCGLHGLVNNAGIATFGTIASMRMEEFDLTIKVNVYGPVMMINAFSPLIIAEQGRIINIGSPSGITDGGGPDIAAYVMSKHAIEGLTDSLVLQLGPLGVQVIAVEPGAYRSEIDKNMLERLTEDEKANMLKVWGPPPDPMMFPQADEVAVAVAQALFEPNPKRRYLAIPRNSPSMTPWSTLDREPSECCCTTRTSFAAEATIGCFCFKQIHARSMLSTRSPCEKIRARQTSQPSTDRPEEHALSATHRPRH